MARRRRVPLGAAAIVGAGIAAGGVSSTVQGLSMTAFLLPFFAAGIFAAGVYFLLGLLRQARLLERSALMVRKPISESYSTFESGCLGLLTSMGFRIRAVSALAQGGIRVDADNEQALMRGRYVIHCVESERPVDALLVGELHAEVTQGRAQKGLYLTNSDFTEVARTFAEGRSLELIDGARLDELLVQYSADAAPERPSP